MSWSPKIGTPGKSGVWAITAGGVCHVSFIAAIAAMMVMMHFGMSLAFGRAHGAPAFICNALLLLQFPLGHSFFLSRGGSRILRLVAPKRIGGDLATTTYATVASWQTAALFLLWSPTGVIWWRAHGAEEVLLDVAQAAAWIGLLKAIMDAGLAVQTGFLGWWSVLRRRAPRYPPMPSTGLFRWCRQPIYLAFSLTLWTVPTWTPDQLMLALGLSAYCLIGPLLKEERFRQRFGEAFTAYQLATPYWLPGLKGRVRKRS